MGGKSQNTATQTHLNKKRQLGQFYTTNYNYILQGMGVPPGHQIIEPFVGAGDLCLWVESLGIGPMTMECYDIAPPKSQKSNFITTIRDTLLNPPDYDGKYVVTNPPFLAKNKVKKGQYLRIFEKWNTNDLYKCFLESLISSNPVGGVVILPLNFFCDDRKVDTRDRFLKKFEINRINIFEESVFEDTTYTTCSVQFSIRKGPIPNKVSIDTHIFPSQKAIKMKLSEESKWKVGSEVYEKPKSKYKVSRLVHTMLFEKDARNKALNPEKENKITNILLNCVDGGKMESRIKMKWNPAPLFGKDTDRAFCTLVIVPAISEEKQKKLIDRFNEKLESYRKKYNSLFLVNYRNSSKQYARKRISFEMAFNLTKKCLIEIEKA
jgi:hypothetical protein